MTLVCYELRPAAANRPAPGGSESQTRLTRAVAETPLGICMGRTWQIVKIANHVHEFYIYHCKLRKFVNIFTYLARHSTYRHMTSFGLCCSRIRLVIELCPDPMGIEACSTPRSLSWIWGGVGQGEGRDEAGRGVGKGTRKGEDMTLLTIRKCWQVCELQDV